MPKGEDRYPLTRPATIALVIGLIVDGKSDTEIGLQLGLTKQAIHEFRKRHAGAIVAEQNKLVAQAAQIPIGQQNRRLLEMNDRWERLQAVIRERAADPTMQDVPGGTTGLLVRRYRSIEVTREKGEGNYETHREMLEEFHVDTGLLSAMAQLEVNAAKELGQIVEPVRGTNIEKAVINIYRNVPQLGV